MAPQRPSPPSLSLTEGHAMGWGKGKGKGKGKGMGLSHPAAVSVHPYPTGLPPRHRAVAFPSQPYPACSGLAAVPDVGKRVPVSAKAGKSLQGRQKCVGKVSASFCKWHGGLSTSLRAVGKAKDVIVCRAGPRLAAALAT